MSVGDFFEVLMNVDVKVERWRVAVCEAYAALALRIPASWSEPAPALPSSYGVVHNKSTVSVTASFAGGSIKYGSGFSSWSTSRAVGDC